MLINVGRLARAVCLDFQAAKLLETVHHNYVTTFGAKFVVKSIITEEQKQNKKKTTTRLGSMTLLLQLFAVLRDLLTDRFQAIFKVCEGNCW